MQSNTTDRLSQINRLFLGRVQKSSGRRLAGPLRETYSPSFWHFPQPATESLPLGSRSKRRIMINEYGSWPPSRHSSSAHSIRLPLVLPSLCGIMAWSACAALHTRNVPAADMRRGTPFFQGAVGCLPGRPFRLHLIPRFLPAVLPQKNSPTPLEGAGLSLFTGQIL